MLLLQFTRRNHKSQLLPLLQKLFMRCQPLAQFFIGLWIHLLQIDALSSAKHHAGHKVASECWQFFIFRQVSKKLVHPLQFLVYIPAIDFSVFYWCHMYMLYALR
jgi:hypothetical protein